MESLHRKKHDSINVGNDFCQDLDKIIVYLGKPNNECWIQIICEQS